MSEKIMDELELEAQLEREEALYPEDNYEND